LEVVEQDIYDHKLQRDEGEAPSMHGIVRFIIKRLILLVPTVFFVLTVIFFALNVLPGDAATILVGLESVSPEGVALIRHRMGLDLPVHVRYLGWIWSVLHGNLGESLVTGVPVQLILTQRLPITLSVLTLTLVVSICLAIPLGVVAALKRNTKFDFLASSMVLIGVSMPTFWLGIILIFDRPHQETHTQNCSSYEGSNYDGRTKVRGI
jgi:peptide/nickel transport system permease protein